MQEFDGPVRKVGSSVKNQGKREYRLCVVCKKKKKETCVLARDKTVGGKTGNGSFWRVLLVQVSYLAVSSERGYFT